ncbi:unnamed protein product, partial [Chrysoparadoxa australica]
GISVRRAEPGDQRSLISLVSAAGGPSKFRQHFGSYNFGAMIESCYLAMVAVADGSGDTDADTNTQLSSLSADDGNAEEIVGFAVLIDSPKTGEAEDWLEWFAEAFPPLDSEANIDNTLWMSFVAALPWSDVASGKIVEHMVRSVFTTLPEVDYIMMTLPKGGSGSKGGDDAGLPEFVSPAFTQLNSASIDDIGEGKSVDTDDYVMVCDRNAYLPTLAVRPACVEDHDDLLPIFEAQSELLTDTYGEFFLADMIQAQDEENKALAALMGHKACGLMAASSDLELGLLQQQFTLESYDQLVKVVPKIILVGPPGSGKTTLARAIAAELGLVLVSVEGEAKAAAAQGNSYGEKALKLLHAGEDVPEAILSELIAKKLAGKECQDKGWVLEGEG